MSRTCHLLQTDKEADEVASILKGQAVSTTSFHLGSKVPLTRASQITSKENSNVQKTSKHVFIHI